jgi:hypothetical protein
MVARMSQCTSLEGRKRLLVSRHKIILQERHHATKGHEADEGTEPEGRPRAQVEASWPAIEDCDDCSPLAMAYPETEEIVKMFHLFEGEG